MQRRQGKSLGWLGLFGLLFTVLSSPAVADAAAEGAPDTMLLQGWVTDMKRSPRGPFARLRWFCADGTVLPPRPYACANRGGGVQHGEWTDQVTQLRAQGYYVANVLAGLDVPEMLADENVLDVVNQILIEQFLMRIDDGWIFRRARFYRGALQAEDERRAARELLLGVLDRPAWRTRHFVLARAMARYLEHGANTGSVAEVRQLSENLAARDPGFERIRNKIHISPDIDDARLVRDYAGKLRAPELAAELETLATLIVEVHSPAHAAERLQQLAEQARRQPRIAQLAADGAKRLAPELPAEQRLRTSAELLAALRTQLATAPTADLALAMLDTSLAVSDAHFAIGTQLRQQIGTASRQDHLGWLRSSIDAAYGVGLISERQRAALVDAWQRLAMPQVPLSIYKQELDYLALLPTWASQRLRLHFGDSMAKLAEIEPLANLFIQEFLRGGPLFFYVQALDGLNRDANRLAGVSKFLFEQEVGAGVRALNPGIAEGVLHIGVPGAGHGYRADGIYLLPETVAELPPVAGLMTLGEGNLLSHVQLLARNLGIPNVAVDEHLLPLLEPARAQRVLLAVSAAGSVRLERAPETKASAREAGTAKGPVIRPDLAKLDLGMRDLLPLGRLRASDAGRVVGPKAAKLGELRYHYPEAVAEGLAIPFGVFRELLAQPYEETGESVFAWMSGHYRELAALPPGSQARIAKTEAFRRKLYDRILNADPGEAFRTRLRAAMADVFGPEGSYGVFVRSDTNIEDLPDFTGAGLNLTVPHVIGFDEVMAAISRVWASPFTARAFAWRQGRMSEPQHVYPAILLLRSVPSGKSGVMVTQDVDTGDPGWLSVAVNEGIGGVVDGQAAEALRIRLDGDEVRLMAQATAPWRRALLDGGGVGRVPVSGDDRVLRDAEIEQLRVLARQLPRRFPELVDGQGRVKPADIEFGFVDGQLALFQIRPFVESDDARGNRTLLAMDAGLAERDDVAVDMQAPPEVKP